MLWSDFYDGHWDWSDSTKRTRISSLEDIGAGDEIVEVVYNIEDPKIKAQLIRKAMKLGAKFTSDDLMELEGEITEELCVQLAQYCGFDSTYPFLDENNMSWEDFYDNYGEWDDATLERRIQKLNQFGSTEEIVEVVQCMPSSKLEKLLYEKALAAGIKFTEEERLSMRNLGEIIRDAINSMPSDEEIEQFGKNVQVLCDQIETTVNPPKPQRPKGLGFGWGLLAVIIGLVSGFSQNSKTSHSHRCDGNCAACPPHYGYRYGRWYYGHGHQWGCQRGGNGGATGRTYRD